MDGITEKTGLDRTAIVAEMAAEFACMKSAMPIEIRAAALRGAAGILEAELARQASTVIYANMLVKK